MKDMRRLLPLVVLVLIPAPSSAHADGCLPSTCGSTSSAVPGSSVVFVRPGGEEGALQAFDVRTGQKRFTLPAGVLSADGETFLAAVAPKEKRTTLVRYDASSGKLRRGWSLPHRWFVAAVSADGRHSALVHYSRRSLLLRVGTARKALPASYEVEALSPDGRRVFLVHWKRTGYNLQQLDLATNKLAPTRLAEPDEKMRGQATGAVATRDGDWLLTLYSEPDGHSFVHALDLRTGLAHCIDLPLVGDLTTIGSTALTLSPDERTLYLASPYLGRVTTVDLATLDVTEVKRFRGPTTYEVNMTDAPSATVTPNGRMLTFSANRSVWLYDTAFGVLRKATSVRSVVTGLGFRPDGRGLLVLQRRGPPDFLDAATGERR
jgi:hypothetical protein